MTTILRHWKLTKLPKSYGIIGITDNGIEVAIYTQIAPIENDDHYVIESVNKNEKTILYKGEGICIL